MESMRSKARKPTHPGEILREDVLPALEITQGGLAEKLGVSRRTVSEILHGRRPVTPDMAIRIGRFCGNGPEVWLRMQAALDLWSHARTDPELRAQLVPIERELDRQTMELVRRMFPELAARRDFEPLVEMSIAAARGLSLLDMLHPGSDRSRRQWESFRGLLVGLYEAEATA